MILTGLNVHNVRQVGRQPEDFDIKEEPPPPPTASAAAQGGEAPRKRKARRARKPSPRRSSFPSRKSCVPAKPPVAAAPVAGSAPRTQPVPRLSGTGTARAGPEPGVAEAELATFRASRRRNGSARSPTANIAGIMAASGQRSGRIGITLKVNTDGQPVELPGRRSSGNPSVDSLFCELAVDYVRFRPARDAGWAAGRPGHHLVPRLVSALLASSGAPAGVACPARRALSRP